MLLKSKILLVKPETDAVMVSPNPPDSICRNSNSITVKHISFKLNRKQNKTKKHLNARQRFKN